MFRFWDLIFFLIWSIAWGNCEFGVVNQQSFGGLITPSKPTRDADS